MGGRQCGPLGTETNFPQIDDGTSCRQESSAPGFIGPPPPPTIGPPPPPPHVKVAGITLTPGQGSKPLTLDEMWSLAQTKRGFDSSSGGGADALRQQPSTIRWDPKKRGANVGKGYETFGAIQMIDKDGNRLVLGADYYGEHLKGETWKGPEFHAEARILRAFEKAVPNTVPGGRLHIVVDQEVCPHCKAKLEAFARRKGIVLVESIVPERSWLRDSAKTVTPKSASRSSLGLKVSFRKDLTLRFPTTLKSIGKYAAKSLGLALGQAVLAELLERVNKDVILKQIHDMGPQIESDLQKQWVKALDLQNAGTPAYANVAVEILTVTTIRPTAGGPMQMPTLPVVILKGVDVSDKNINAEGRPRIEPLEGGLGGRATYQPWTFSFDVAMETM